MTRSCIKSNSVATSTSLNLFCSTLEYLLGRLCRHTHLDPILIEQIDRKIEILTDLGGQFAKKKVVEDAEQLRPLQLQVFRCSAETLGATKGADVKLRAHNPAISMVRELSFSVIRMKDTEVVHLQKDLARFVTQRHFT